MAELCATLIDHHAIMALADEFKQSRDEGRRPLLAALHAYLQQLQTVPAECLVCGGEITDLVASIGSLVAIDAPPGAHDEALLVGGLCCHCIELDRRLILTGIIASMRRVWPRLSIEMADDRPIGHA
jgi:hypothetical protein